MIRVDATWMSTAPLDVPLVANAGLNAIGPTRQITARTSLRVNMGSPDRY